jgi:hypothetical protein
VPKRWIVLLLAAWAVLAPTSVARAASDDARGALAEAEQAERDLDFSRADAAWERLARLDARGRLGRRAAARLDWLRARKSGDYRALSDVERIRRTPHVSVEALSTLEARAPSIESPVLRREARALVAESYLRADRPLDAIRAHEAWLAEPGLSDADWLRASNGLAVARSRLGDLGGALDTLRERGLGQRVEATELRLRLLSRVLRPVGVALIAVFILLAAIAGLSRRPLRTSLATAFSLPRVLAAAWMLGVPLLLASQHRPETWRTLVLLVPGAFVVLALAAFAGPGLGDASARRRALLAVLAVLAQVSVAYLALDESGALLGWVLALGVG